MNAKPSLQCLSLFACIAVCVSVPGGNARAQMQWGETNVTLGPEPGASAAPGEPAGPDFLDPSLGPITIAGPSEAEEAPAARVIGADELPRALTYDEADALRQRASAATVEVVATFQRDPLLAPNLVEVRGAATAVLVADDAEPALVTASYLVEGATTVQVQTPAGLVDAEVEYDRNLGLATLRVRDAEDLGLEPLRIAEETDADSQEEGFTTATAGGGATLGAADGEYGFYQLNTLGAVLGYPILNREGELVGIGSHRYPPRPDLSLSVPADQVESYLTR